MKKAVLHNAKCVTTKNEYYSMLIRKVINVSNIKKAKITVASFGFFYGFINGKRISDDMFVPLSTDYHERKNMVIQNIPFDEELGHRLYCPVYDVTEFLVDGDNALCFMVGAGWYNHLDWEITPRYGKIKLAYCLEITHNDGSVEYIISDENDKVCEGFAKAGDILEGEAHDYTSYDDNWINSDYNDSGWENSEIEQMPETNLYEQDCPSDKVIRKIDIEKIAEKNGAKIYDVGEIISGYPVISVKSGNNSEIKIRYSELLNDDKRLKEENTYNQHTNIKACGKSRIIDTQFTWYCFRYIEVIGECEIEECLVIHTEAAVTSSFECDNETLNWLYDSFIRTQLANMHAGIPSDCPHVERKGYTGDGQLTCRAAMNFLDVKKFYEKWIYDISDCQDRKTGHVQYTAPYLYSGGGPGGWGGAIVLVPYYYYKQYGDAEILREMYPQMLKYFDYMEAHSEKELVTTDRPNGWCLGEWCTPEQMVLDDKDGVKLPQPFVNTYFYIKTIQLVIEIEKILGVNDKTKMLTERINRKKTVMTEQYFDVTTGNFCNNEQGANCFAFDIGLGDNRTLYNAIEHYEEIGHYDTGIFGTDIVTRVMFEQGRGDIAYKLLTSKDEISFYNQMKMGATTILENWNGVRSQCHPMFGAVSTYLAEYILGIRKTTVAFCDVVIEPMCMDKVKSAKGYITTVNGEIGVKYDENEIIVNIPKNVNVEVIAKDRKIEIIRN